MGRQRKRDLPFQTVSPLPVLVPAGESDSAIGYANFLRQPDGVQVWKTPKVRLIAKKDLREHISKLQKSDRQLLTAILELKKGYEVRDRLAMQHGYEALSWPWFPFYKSDSVAEQAAFFSETHWPKFHVVQIVTETLRDARLVLWFFDQKQQFLPAVYCPTVRTAVFLNALLGNAHACPYCKEVFVSTHGNVAYCSEKH